MANSIAILNQLLLLFSIMIAGYIAFKKGWVDEHGSSQISSLIVKIFNPILMLSITIGSEYRPSARLIIENIVLMVIFFASLIFIAPIVAMIIIPIAASFIIGIFNSNVISPVIGGIMILMYGMPNASLPIIVCEEYGIKSDMLSCGYALTTILALVTLPIVTLFI